MDNPLSAIPAGIEKAVIVIIRVFGNIIRPAGDQGNRMAFLIQPQIGRPGVVIFSPFQRLSAANTRVKLVCERPRSLKTFSSVTLPSKVYSFPPRIKP
jgi:hypothetical protein